MGNQLPGNPQSGQVVDSLLQNFANNPNSMPFMVPGQEAPANAKALNKLKNNKFIRGQQSNVGFIPNSRPHEDYANKPHSPIHGVYDPGSGSKPSLYQNNPINYSNNYANSSVVDPTRSPRNPQLVTPTNMRSRIVDPPKQKGFFQQLFNISDTESQKKLRSSSASHASISGNDRKISLLESNVQVLEKKLQTLNFNLQNSERGAEQLKFNLKNSEARLEVSEANLKRTQQRAFYLQNQLNQIQIQYNSSQNQLKKLQNILNQSNLQIQGLRQVLIEKDKRIYDGQIQVKTQMSQLQLLESRLQQLTVRDERKDKQIRQLSSAKFELNATRIRLQNNLKINEEQLQIKNRKISQLDAMIVNKNKQLSNIRQEKVGLEQNVVELKSELQNNLQKYEQQSNKLSLAIRNHLITIEDNQSHILELTSKIDKHYQNEAENQASISMLQGYISESKLAIEKLQNDVKNLHQENRLKGENIQQIQSHLAIQKIEADKHRDTAEKIIVDYNNAKKIGQKQIQFLQNKLEQFTREKQRLLEQIQVTKAVTIQRNKVFQRKIIYDLKQQNDKLWAKLIQHSESAADLQSGDWKVKIEEVKNTRMKNQKQNKQTDSKSNKNLLEQRFDAFIRQLEQNQNEESKPSGLAQDVNNQSLQKMQQNVRFYQQKCNQLEKMIQSHIIINKSLKDQIQKNTYYEANFKIYSVQMEKILLINKTLKDQNIKLKNSLDTLRPESQLKERKAQSKSKQLQSQNAKFFQDIGKMRSQLQTQKNQSRKNADEVRRLNNQISVYKKWQGLYDDLKKKYDLLMVNSKEDYKGMYEELLKQLSRLRNLYEMKQSDFDKLKKVDSQKFQAYEKQLKAKNAEIQMMSKDYDNLARQFDVGKQQYQRLFKQFSAMEDQLNNLRMTSSSKLDDSKF